MHSKPLYNKIAIVAGGADEMSRAISVRLAAAGALVIIFERNVKRANKIVAEITVNGWLSEFYRTDLINKKDIENSIKQVLAKYARADILVNNIGGPGFLSPMGDTPVQEVNDTSKANLASIFHLSKLLLPKMVENKYGRIINICSYTLIVPPQDSAVLNKNHAEVKAVHALTRTSSREVASYGITVNAITPIPIQTGRMLLSSFSRMAGAQNISPQEMLKKFQEGSSISRLSGENAAAEMVMFLVSMASQDVTGEIFNVTGDFFCGNGIDRVTENEIRTTPGILGRTGKALLKVFRVFHASRGIFF